MRDTHPWDIFICPKNTRRLLSRLLLRRLQILTLPLICLTKGYAFETSDSESLNVGQFSLSYYQLCWQRQILEKKKRESIKKPTKVYVQHQSIGSLHYNVGRFILQGFMHVRYCVTNHWADFFCIVLQKKTIITQY